MKMGAYSRHRKDSQLLTELEINPELAYDDDDDDWDDDDYDVDVVYVRD